MHDLLLLAMSRASQAFDTAVLLLAQAIRMFTQAAARLFNSTFSALGTVFAMVATAIVNFVRNLFMGRTFTISRLAVMLLFFTVCSLNLGAQTLDFTSPESLFGGMEILYGAVVIIGGYLSSFIPGLRNIDNGIYRVLTWAIMTGIGFALFGSDIVSLAVTYAISTSLYEVIFKLFKPSPDPEPSPGLPGGRFPFPGEQL